MTQDGVNPSSDEVHTDLVNHINKLQKEIGQIRRDLVRTLAVSVVTILIVLGISIWYAGHVRSQADKVWCSLIVSLDDRYQKLLQAPAQTNPDQQRSIREFAAQMHQLKSDLGCK